MRDPRPRAISAASCKPKLEGGRRAIFTASANYGADGAMLLSEVPKPRACPTTPAISWRSMGAKCPVWLGWAYFSIKVPSPWHQGVCFDLPMIFCA
jgi:hypothetical protein